MPKNTLVDIECRIVKHEEMSIAIVDGTVEFRNGREREKWFWLPRSQIEIDGDDAKAIVTMPEWLALKKELI